MEVEKAVKNLEDQFISDVQEGKADGAPVRVNIKVSKFVKEFFEKKSNETGVTQSALMAIALAEYVEQKKSVYVMTEFNEMIKKETAKAMEKK
jgi:hypothetical protein